MSTNWDFIRSLDPDILYFVRHFIDANIPAHGFSIEMMAEPGLFRCQYDKYIQTLFDTGQLLFPQEIGFQPDPTISFFLAFMYFEAINQFWYSQQFETEPFFEKIIPRQSYWTGKPLPRRNLK